MRECDNRIRKVDSSGIITTVAGNDFYGYSGDGGPATEAALDFPLGVTTDGNGYIFIADTNNLRIRKVDSNGTITTVAGNGFYGYSGDEGPATEAALDHPFGVAVDANGNIFIADTDNHCIRKVLSRTAKAGVVSSGDLLFADKNGEGFVMSASSLHKKTIGLNTQATLLQFDYDANDRLVSITDQFGNLTTIERNASGIPTAVVSPDGLRTELTIDSNNHLARIAYPDNSHYDFEYTSEGLLSAKIDPNGNRFTHVFDENGRLTVVFDEAGGNWQYSRIINDDGKVETHGITAEGDGTTYLDRTDSTGAFTSIISDASGAETSFSQSADGLSAEKSLPCGTDISIKYDLDSQYKFPYVKEMTEQVPSGLTQITSISKAYEDTDSDEITDRITEEITVNGKKTVSILDILDSKNTMTSPAGRTVTNFFDPETLVTTKTSIPSLLDTAYEYDSKGRLTGMATGERHTYFTYNEKGNLSSITDPEEATTTYEYDAVGRLTAVLRPDGTSIGFSYDLKGNLAVLTTPSEIDHGFGYNAVNLNMLYETPLSGDYSYSYDRNRRLVQTNFPSGKQIENVYGQGRLDQIRTPEGNIDFTYLCSTKVKSITNGEGSIGYEYDGPLVTSETLSGTLNQTLSFAYDNDFNLDNFTYAGGTTTFRYDDDGLLTGAGRFDIGRNEKTGLPESVSSTEFNLTSTFSGYGEPNAQSFAVNGTDLVSWGIVRDDTGRIAGKIETIGGTTSSFIYEYDSTWRLLEVTKDESVVEQYQYGPNGARTHETNALRGIFSRTLAYSDEDHLLTAGNCTYEYDLDGFLTRKTENSNVTSYSYSSRGELLEATLPDGTVVENVHDVAGRRIAKKIDGNTVEKYLWQGLAALLAVFDGDDNLIMRFEYADRRTPVAMKKNGNTYYLAYDQVGSLRLVADSAGNVVKQIDYDSFGNIIGDTNSAFEIPFGFAGGLHDRDTGLVRFGARDYDPGVGRWTAKDPIFFAGSHPDLYGYARNDPINRIDNSGLLDWRSARHRYRNKNNFCPFIIPSFHAGRGEYLDYKGYRWEPDKGYLIKDYHNHACGWRTFRKGERPSHPFAEPGWKLLFGRGGSQCTYDNFGNIVLSGPQQGTYDFWKAGTLMHWIDDAISHETMIKEGGSYVDYLTRTY